MSTNVGEGRMGARGQVRGNGTILPVMADQERQQATGDGAAGVEVQAFRVSLSPAKAGGPCYAEIGKRSGSGPFFGHSRVGAA